MVAYNCQKELFTEMFKQFWATVNAQSPWDRYWSDYFHKIWVENYCLAKNHTEGLLNIPGAKSTLAASRFYKTTKIHIGKFLKLIIFLK